MKTILLAALCLYSINGRAQSINDLDFIAGKWKTTTEWGDMEEVWSKPLGNNMMCSYRCVKDGKVVFYEFIVIEEDISGIAMKLRHFTPGSIGLEEKDKPYSYPLVLVEKDQAIFEAPDKNTRMEFKRLSAERLQVLLHRKENGKATTDEFLYTQF